MTWADEYNNSYSRSGYVNNPTATTQPSPANAVNQNTIRIHEDAALAEMTTARARILKQFEATDKVRTALRDVQNAQRAYDAAVAEANRHLQDNPHFQQAQEKKEIAEQRVEAAQAADRQRAQNSSATQPAPISRDLVRAAEGKLHAATQASTLVQEDPQVVDARQNLQAATDRLNDLKVNFDASLQSDPQWQSAKAKLDAARAGEAK